MKKLIVTGFSLLMLTSCGQVEEVKEIDNPKYTQNYTELRSVAKGFCEIQGLNTEFFFLVDYSIHSGKKRMFVIDFKKGIIDSFLVSHGCGPNPWARDSSKTNPVISNVPESHCSSVGRFKIGKRGYSTFGSNVKYDLIGLDSSNSNALSRYVLLHSWELMPTEEIYPNGSPEGYGCVALSISSFTVIDKLLKDRKDKALLWAIY
jgi:hypothetical protein